MPEKSSVSAVRRTRPLLGLVLVLAASTGVQVSAVLAHGLFDRLGPSGVSGLRFAVAAVVMMAVLRPNPFRLDRRRWIAVLALGAAIAAMNVSLYSALDHLPFGLALTLEFLGPFAVAAAGVRRPRMAVFPVLGLIGVALVLRPSADLDPWGLVWAAAAAVSLGAYTVLTEKVGDNGSGVGDLALSLVVAALLTAPAAVQALPAVLPADLPVLLVAAILGVALAFSADLQAVQVTSARTVAVLLSMDPALAAIIGTVALGQHLDGWSLLGIGCIAVAGGCTTWVVARRGEQRRSRASAGGPMAPVHAAVLVAGPPAAEPVTG